VTGQPITQRHRWMRADGTAKIIGAGAA
jgi:hypothetical protein